MKIEPVMGNIKESKLLRVIEQKVLDEFNKNILQTSYKNIPFKEIPSLEMISYDYIYCSSFPLIGFMGLD
jgi:Zn-dependent M16 (insulinase) family peptidase